MTTKISDELMNRLEEIEAEEAGNMSSQREISVILTIEPDADLTALEKKGFKLERKFEHIPAVAGTLPANKEKVMSFADELDQVQSIEYDGEVYAISKTVPDAE